MKERVLIILKDANEEIVPLKKEKILIGRDSSCDIVWKEAEFSREHIAIHFKHDNVYIENISTGGQVKINGKDTEYGELREGVEAHVGPYILKWTYRTMLDKFEKSNPVIEESGIKAFSDSPQSGLDHIEDTQPSASDPLLGGDLPVLESTLQASAEDIGMSPEIAAAIADDDTVTHMSGAIGLIRITAGEIAGREIKLEHGKEWIVGRARECHVSIDNPKMSRHHFKILQIGAGFRVQDLDSSYGIKINGVTVKDAPIKSFDVLTAGPVELQFVIVDKNMKELPSDISTPLLTVGVGAAAAAAALPALMKDDGVPGAGSVHNERTNYPPIVSGAAPSSFQFSKPSLENSHSQGNFVSVADKEAKKLPKEKILALVAKFKEQPTPRKILILLLPVLIITGILSTLSPEAPAEAELAQNTEEKAETNPTTAEATTEENPAESSSFTPEYQLKSAKEKAEIQSLYAQAENARDKGDWQKAHDLAQDIVRRVGKYKRTSEIIAEAQGYLTELQIATLTRTDGDAETAAAAAKQKVEELLQQGETALSEKRWDDALEIYSKALLMDPKNDKATRGQYAAQAKDSSALGKQLALEREIAQQPKQAEPSPTPEVQITPDAATMELMSQEYQAAKQKIQEGGFREALPVLKQLKGQVERMIAEDESNRSPAAAVSEDKRNMRSKIVESLDLINDQFVLEYKTQMDDAQQSIANQKYVEARAIYDTIIKREPLFDEPRIEREKLYKKMISDGQTAYREGLVSESVGDLTAALELYEKAKSYFESINKKEAEEYYSILDKKLKVLKK